MNYVAYAERPSATLDTAALFIRPEIVSRAVLIAAYLAAFLFVANFVYNEFTQ